MLVLLPHRRSGVWATAAVVVRRDTLRRAISRAGRRPLDDRIIAIAVLRRVLPRLEPTRQWTARGRVSARADLSASSGLVAGDTRHARPPPRTKHMSTGRSRRSATASSPSSARCSAWSSRAGGDDLRRSGHGADIAQLRPSFVFHRHLLDSLTTCSRSRAASMAASCGRPVPALHGSRSSVRDGADGETTRGDPDRGLRRCPMAAGSARRLLEARSTFRPATRARATRSRCEASRRCCPSPR